MRNKMRSARDFRRAKRNRKAATLALVIAIVALLAALAPSWAGAIAYPATARLVLEGFFFALASGALLAVFTSVVAGSVTPIDRYQIIRANFSRLDEPDIELEDWLADMPRAFVPGSADLEAYHAAKSLIGGWQEGFPSDAPNEDAAKLAKCFGKMFGWIPYEAEVEQFDRYDRILASWQRQLQRNEHYARRDKSGLWHLSSPGFESVESIFEGADGNRVYRYRIAHGEGGIEYAAHGGNPRRRNADGSLGDEPVYPSDEFVPPLDYTNAETVCWLFAQMYCLSLAAREYNRLQEVELDEIGRIVTGDAGGQSRAG